MKLIVRQYLRSLRERGELDAVLPDLLSTAGLHVFARPGRGTRQYGVDIGAFGRLDSEEEKVYLLVVKPGDLGRHDWDSGPQSVRQSLNDVLEVYIPTHLPAKYRGKPIVVCTCVGGEVLEPIALTLATFEESAVTRHAAEKVSFERWNGDYLAGLVDKYFLREELVPGGVREGVRKTIALLAEPEAAESHFSAVAVQLLTQAQGNAKTTTDALYRLNMCLWIVLGWSREAGRREAAYLCAEVALLHAWEIVKKTKETNRAGAKESALAFTAVLDTYVLVCDEYRKENIVPYVGIKHGLSFAVEGGSSVDVSLKLFDILGRVSVAGLWALWSASNGSMNLDGCTPEEAAVVTDYSTALVRLIANNPTLLLPVSEAQVSDVSLAAALLAATATTHGHLRKWLSEMLYGADLMYRANGSYPCVTSNYVELLAHPESATEEYRRRATAGSELYPLIAVWAALFDDTELLERVAKFKAEQLSHCNFQLWYPSADSEEHFYLNTASHGAALSGVCVERSKGDLLDQVFGECSRTAYFHELSAVATHLMPIVAVACRRYRLPLPFCAIDVSALPGAVVIKAATQQAAQPRKRSRKPK